MIDPLQLGILKPSKLIRFVLFWYRQLLAFMLAYWCFSMSGRGFGNEIPDIGYKEIILFFKDGTGLLFCVYWITAIVVVRYLLTLPAYLIGWALALYANLKSHWLEFARFFDLVWYHNSDKTKIFKGKWFKYVGPFVDSVEDGSLYKDVIREYSGISAAVVGTLILTYTYDIDGIMFSLLRKGLWISSFYVYLNLVFIQFISAFIKVTGNRLLNVVERRARNSRFMDTTAIFPRRVKYSYLPANPIKALPAD